MTSRAEEKKRACHHQVRVGQAQGRCGTSGHVRHPGRRTSLHRGIQRLLDTPGYTML